jgi:hypothetical protein
MNKTGSEAEAANERCNSPQGCALLADIVFVALNALASKVSPSSHVPVMFYLELHFVQASHRPWDGPQVRCAPVVWGKPALAEQYLHAPGSMNRVVGHITIVQEDRFRLVTDDGRGLLLTLKHNAGVTDEALRRLRDDQQRVAVNYDGEADFEDGIVSHLEIATNA